VLGGVVIATLLGVIVIGFTHFSPSLAFSFPPNAFHLNGSFFTGLGAGLLVAAYDYWGYYNVCFLGAEVRDPSRTIPRAVIGAIVVVGILYLLMNVSVLGILPWRSLTHSSSAERQYTMAVFVQTAFASHTWAHAAASTAVILIAIASLASVYALLLGYSRIPYAAARDGNFPAIFARLHPRHGFPVVSLSVLCLVTLICCLFRLQEVIASLVVLRIVFQFLLQGIAVLLPKHRAERARAGRFRMPLYPLPSLIATGTFVFILLSRPKIVTEFRLALFVLVSGLLIYALRSRHQRNA
jgi:amino acid transporter